MTPRPVKYLRAGILAVIVAAQLSGCVPPPKPAPAPAPAPAARPLPPPPPPPPPGPAPSNWLDAPQTPGDWRYAAGTATFGLPGQPRLSLRCAQPGQSVELGYLGAGTGLLTIRTEAMDRALSAPADQAGQSIARIAANDPLLDALAYSRGRFAVEAADAQTLYVPAWPEVARVVEDCR
jgi:hypothetical protein